MKRRNFIKIATGAFLGLATGVGLAKKKEKPFGYAERQSFHMFDELRPDYDDDLIGLIKMREFLQERAVKALPSGKYVLVVHRDSYEKFKELNDRYKLGYIVLKDYPCDGNLIDIPALSKER